jgi:hypothetical protein
MGFQTLFVRSAVIGSVAMTMVSSVQGAGLARSVPGPSAVTTAGARQGGADREGELSANGTFVGGPGLNGSVDASRWRVVSDPGSFQPPRFVPATAAAVTPGVWSAVAPNLAGTDGAFKYTVLDIAFSATDMYVAGLFTNTDGNARADYVVRRNGTSWSALGGGTNGALNGGVEAMAFIGNDLYVGGSFTNAGGHANADYLAKWDGTSWSAVGANGTGPALNGAVYSLAVRGSDLYVGGAFQDAGGVVEADRLARWDGAWHSVGATGDNEPALRNGVVRSVVVSGTDLYVGGTFTDAGYNNDADYVARYDGNGWYSLGVGGPATATQDQGVHAILVDGSNVYIGGWFYDWAGLNGADNVAGWDGANWHALGSNAAGTDGALDAYVDALAMLNGYLYVGGLFKDAAGIAAADYIALWDGTAWSAPGSYAGDGAIRDIDHAQSVEALERDGNTMLVGGNFYNTAGDPTADWLVRYTPSTLPYRPDALIRKGSGSFVGDDIYNLSGTYQTRTASIAAGSTAKFGISIQNDGSLADSFNLSASGAAVTGYTIHYLRGTNDITSAVLAGTYRTGTLAPGAAVLITVKVGVGARALAGSSVARLVRQTSVGDPSLADAVKLVVKRA